MKKNNLLIPAFLIIAITFTSCSGNQSANTKNTQVGTNTAAIEENNSSTTRTIKYDNKTLEYTGKYEFVLNEQMSKNIKSVNPNITDASYYKLITPPNATIGMSYQKLKSNTNINNTINGILNGYDKVEGVKIIDEHIEDVTAKYGYTAKLSTGIMQITNERNEKETGEYKNLIIDNKNEIWIIQGIFETVGSKEANNYMEILNSIKIK